MAPLSWRTLARLGDGRFFLKHRRDVSRPVEWAGYISPDSTFKINIMIVYFVFWDKKRVAVFHVVNGGLTMTPKRRSSNLRQSISGIFFDNGKTPEDFFYGCVRCKYAIFFLFASCINESKNKTVKKLSGLLCPHLSLWENFFCLLASFPLSNRCSRRRGTFFTEEGGVRNHGGSSTGGEPSPHG